MTALSNVKELAALRDEVNEPLGNPARARTPNSAHTIAWKIAPVAAPVVVAVAMAAFTFGRHGAPPRFEPLAARTVAAPASAPAAPASSPGTDRLDNPAPPPIAAAERIEGGDRRESDPTRRRSDRARPAHHRRSAGARHSQGAGFAPIAQASDPGSPSLELGRIPYAGKKAAKFFIFGQFAAGPKSQQ